MGMALLRQALAMSRMGRSREALPIAERADGLLTRHLAEEEMLVGESMAALGLIQKDLGNLAEAERAARRNYLWARDHPGTRGDGYVQATAAANLGSALKKLGRYSEAEPMYLEALERALAVGGEDNSRVAGIRTGLGILYSDVARHEEGIRELEAALRTYELALGANSADSGRALINLGGALTEVGRLDEAAAHLARAVEIYERVYGPDDPVVADPLAQQATLASAREEYELSARLCSRVLDLRLKQLGADHPDTARARNNLAVQQTFLGDFAGAAEQFAGVVTSWERALGPDHPDLSTPYSNLACAQYQMGQWEPACENFAHALALREKALPSRDDPDTKSDAILLARSLDNLGKASEAADVRARYGLVPAGAKAPATEELGTD